MKHKIFLFHHLLYTEDHFDTKRKDFVSCLKATFAMPTTVGEHQQEDWLLSELSDHSAHTPWLVERLESFLSGRKIEWLEIRTLSDPLYYIYDDDGMQRLVTYDMLSDADSPTD